MAKVYNKEQLKNLQNIEKHEIHITAEKRARRLLSVIDKCHKVNLFHKIKERLFGKCSVCKELQGLR